MNQSAPHQERYLCLLSAFPYVHVLYTPHAVSPSFTHLRHYMYTYLYSLHCSIAIVTATATATATMSNYSTEPVSMRSQQTNS